MLQGSVVNEDTTVEDEERTPSGVEELASGGEEKDDAGKVLKTCSFSNTKVIFENPPVKPEQSVKPQILSMLTQQFTILYFLVIFSSFLQIFLLSMT